MNNNVRKLTDGALMLALIGIFIFLDIQLGGMLSGYIVFLVPLPLALYGAKYGMHDGLVVWFATSLMAVILGGFTELFYIACYGMGGLYYGNGVYKHKEMAKVIVVTCLITIFTNAITTVILASVFGYDLASDIAMFKNVFDQINFTQLTGIINIESIIKSMIVISTIILGIMEGFIIHFCSKILLTRLKFNVPRADFSIFKVGKWTGYLAFIGFIAYNILYGRISDPRINDALFVFSMLCSLYLIIYGIIGSYNLLGKFLGTTNNGLRVIIIIIVFMLFNLLLLTIGFIYLTTDIKERINE